jgi:hypothetical protein
MATLFGFMSQSLSASLERGMEFLSEQLKSSGRNPKPTLIYSIRVGLALQHFRMGEPVPLFVDLDGDGKTDLAVGDQAGNTVSVFYGNGDGTLKSRIEFGAGLSPLALATGDFDGNGRNDLAVASHDSNAATMLLNRCVP